MKGNKLEHKDVLKFMFGGNSSFTVINTDTNNRFTYKMKRAKNSDLFFVSVLTSPDHYSYLGVCTKGTYSHGKKSKISENSQSVQVFKFILNKLKLNKLSDVVEVWHMGLCGKCNRPLTVPQSIQLGLGPDCFKNLSKQNQRDSFLNLILC